MNLQQYYDGDFCLEQGFSGHLISPVAYPNINYDARLSCLFLSLALTLSASEPNLGLLGGER